MSSGEDPRGADDGAPAGASEEHGVREALVHGLGLGGADHSGCGCGCRRLWVDLSFGRIGWKQK